MRWEWRNLEAAGQWNFITGVEKPCYISLNKDRSCTYSLPAWLYIRHRHNERTRGNMKGHFHHGSVDVQRKYMTAQRKKLFYANSLPFGGACFDNTKHTALYRILRGLDDEEDCDITGSVWCVDGCPCSKWGGFFMEVGSLDAHESLIPHMQNKHICKKNQTGKTSRFFF